MSIKGELNTIPITTILQMLCDENKTGVLRAWRDRNQVKFFLKDGEVLCVMGTLKRARLGNILRNSNLVSQQNLIQCLELARGKNRTLGSILIEERVVTPEKLGRVVNKQAEEIIFDLFTWGEGQFEYKDGRINLKNMEIIPINVMGLILETMRRKDELESLLSEPPMDEKPAPQPEPAAEVIAICAEDGDVVVDDAIEIDDQPLELSDEEDLLSENEWARLWDILHENRSDESERSGDERPFAPLVDARDLPESKMTDEEAAQVEHGLKRLMDSFKKKLFK